MQRRISILLAVVSILAAGTLLSASTASASKQVLVKLDYRAAFFFTGYTLRQNTKITTATVLTTAGTPTPPIIWPRGVVAGNYTFSATYFSNTPYFFANYHYENDAGILSKANPNAAPASGSTVFPPGLGTTLCFANNPGVIHGGVPLPNECFPRIGKMTRTGGTKGFGGNARMIRPNSFVGFSLAGVPSGASNWSVRGAWTDRLTGPGYNGNYGIGLTGDRTNTVVPVPLATQEHFTTAPHTTGTVGLTFPASGTIISAMGSHNFNATNLTGMISVVQPTLVNVFSRTKSTGLYAGPRKGFAFMDTVVMTFAGEVPEPGLALMLSCGVLGVGLLGSSSSRRRR